ncbi:MAG TPA: hypothetical protein VIM87_28975 [Chitinophaga sp.]|uniref:hypothetical protein n=1 Tax=Chitinophaga sp. TaxID=1869181 RepID=UPI002F943D2C
MKKIIPLFFFILMYTVARGQQYEVAMDLSVYYNGNADKADCSSRFEITAYYSDGTNVRVWTESLDGLRENEVRTYPTKTFTFANTKRLVRFHIFGRRSWDRGFPAGCKRNDVEASQDIYVSPSQPCFTYHNGNFIPRYTGDMNIRIYPRAVNITPTTATLPDATTVTLTATNGFPNSTYQWQYRTTSTGWNNFPSNFPMQRTITFSGNDLPNNFFLGAIERRENILVRVYYPCGTTESNTVTLTPRFVAPTILSVTPIPPTCYGDQNGSFIVRFSRPLRPREGLVMQLDKQEIAAGNPAAFIDDRQITMDGNNSYQWTPSDRGARKYRILLRGSYPTDIANPVPIYTGAAQHRANFEIVQPGPITFSSSKQNDVRCHSGADGAINITTSGGNGGNILYYKNAADGITRQVSIGNVTAYTLGGLNAGTYSLWLRDSKGCMPKDASNNEITRTETITEPAASLVIDAATPTDPKAFGYSDGSVVVRIKGGTPNVDGSYNVTWTNASGAVFPQTGIVGSGVYTTTLENVPDGIYTLRVTDANHASAGSGSEQGCIVTATYPLTQPPLLEVTPTITDSINCHGDGNGILSALATGGKRMSAAPFYTYEWYQLVGGTLTPLGQTGTQANGLTAGQYQVKVTDANNIEKLSDVINLIDPDSLKIQFTTTPVSCYSGSNGVLTTVVTGGTPAYQYNWSNSAQSADIYALPTGTYTLRIKDYHGCELTDVAYVPQPAEPLQIVTPTLIYPKAFGYTDGSIKVLLKGGTALAGGAYNVTWQKPDGTVLTSHYGQLVNGVYEDSLANIGAGDYNITVTDANYTGPDPNMQSCIVTAGFTLEEPPALVVNIAEKHYVSCKGDMDGVLFATASGGVPISGPLPYQFEWYKADNSGAYNPIGETNDTAHWLNTGIYKVIITDWNGITKESDTFHLVEPELLQVALTTRNVSCNGGNDGFIKSTVTGGTLPYAWVWSNSDATQDILDQPAGHYTLLLTDGHGCEQQPDTVITQPAAPLAVVNVTTIDPKAYTYTDGSISITLNGGTPAADGSYSVQWLNSNNQVLSTHTEQVQPGQYTTTLQNVGDGTYTLQVKDAQFSICTNNSTSGCYVSVANTLHEPPLLKASIAEHRYVACKGDSDGELVAHATGGIPFSSGLPYAYRWFKVVNGSLQPVPQTDSIITGMPSGKYLVQVTDYNNITRSSDTFHLTEPDKLTVALNATAVSCASGQDGSITALVSGGTAPFHYEWTTGDTTSTLHSLTEGAYLLFVKDGHNCETQNNVDIFIPGGITIDADIKAPTCHSDCDGYIKTTISGGVAPYRYQWSTGQTGTALDKLCAGKYTLTITDANNCKRIQTFNLGDPAPLQVQLGPDKTLCNDQTWLVNAAIADPQAKYVWGGNPALQALTPQVTLSQTGQYWVNVTDSKGCKGSDTINIQQNKVAISAEFVAATQIFQNEDVSFVNISNPLPEKIEWVIPANRNITVVQNTPLLAELRFADTGVYRIQLRTRVGDCEKLFSKDIAVLEKQTFTQPGGAAEPFIKTFEILPNPNTGQFNVRIALDKASDIRLRLFNIISNQLVNDRKESAAVQFNVGYQLNITAGTYLLLLETPMGNAIRKIIISQ